jgi:hypothetical protein
MSKLPPQSFELNHHPPYDHTPQPLPAYLEPRRGPAVRPPARMPRASEASLERIRPAKPVTPINNRLARAKTVRHDVDEALARSRRLRAVRLASAVVLALAVFGGVLYLLVTLKVLVENVSAPLAAFALAGEWNWAIVLGGALALVSSIALLFWYLIRAMTRSHE